MGLGALTILVWALFLQDAYCPSSPPHLRQNQPWAEVAPSPSLSSRASGSFSERRRQVSLAGEPGGSALHGKRRRWPPSRAGGMSTPLAVAFLTPAWRWPLGMANEYCTGDEASTLMGTRSFVPSFILSFVLRETREKLPPGVFHTFFKGPTANRAGECLLSRSLAVLELQLCPRGGSMDESRTGPWPLDESRTGPWPQAGGCALLCLPGVLRDTETIRGGGAGPGWSHDPSPSVPAVSCHGSAPVCRVPLGSWQRGPGVTRESGRPT